MTSAYSSLERTQTQLLYSISEFSKKTGIGVSTLRKKHKDGSLIPSHVSAGNHRYYSHNQLLELLNKPINTSKSVLDGSVVLITGSGTLATEAVSALCPRARKVIIFSRDEHKHRLLRIKYPATKNLRFIIGDIQDVERLNTAMRGVDVVIHTAALKMIETGFYSPDAVVKINTIGSLNVAQAAINQDVKVALFISSDKACNPMNGLTYGLSKALAESAWISYNNYSTRDGTKLCATRYGNIINSNNSFYWVIKEQSANGKIKITDPNMSRFYFTIQEAMELNIHAIDNCNGGEIFIPKLKSANIMDFVNAFAPNIPVEIIGMRSGIEKMAEELISQNEMHYTYVSGDKYFQILPPYIELEGKGWDLGIVRPKPIMPFVYRSDSPDVERLSPDDLRDMVK